jgi:ABC-type transport system substrate-binding protein
MRTDKPPFSDKRVRQALSMAIDRKAIAEAVTQGEGEPDQGLSWTGTYWGFRKPKDLGAAAKYWNYDVAEAKKLLAAAGVSLPIKVDLPTWNATVIGQKHVDNIVLITTQWRNAGILDAKLLEMTFGQFASTASIGNYDSIYWGPNTVATVPDIGAVLMRELFAPPEGLKVPTGNQSYVNNPEMSALVQKQLGQFKKDERVQTFRRMEDILAEEQYRIASVTSSTNWFGDPSVKNMQTPREAYNGATPYIKYWWFDK